MTNKQVQLTVEEQQTYRYNALKMNGFSELDIQMIMDSEKNPPIQYLEALKIVEAAIRHHKNVH